MYFGLFKVTYKTDLKMTFKYFTLLQNGALNNVSINRLKSTHLPLLDTDKFVQSSTRDATELTDDVDL